MRTETTREQLPYDHTVYICEEEGCDFRTKEAWKAERHHGETHAIKERATVGNVELVRVESKENLAAYMKAQPSDCTDEPDWKGPDWYQVFNKWKPCGFGCCSKSHTQARPARWVLEDMRSELTNLRSHVNCLEEFLEAQAAP